MNFIALTLALLLASAWEPATPPPAAPVLTQQSKDISSDQTPSINAMLAQFTKYEIAVVQRGPKWTKDAPAKLEKLSAKRGDYWKPLIEQGKVLGVVRPVKEVEVWGLVFFKVDSKDEMNSIASNAPAVKEGYLVAKILTVWGSRGLGAGLTKDVTGLGKAESKGGTYYLMVTRKGPKWTEKADAPETRAATAEATKYLYDLYKRGSLRYFAALEDFSLKIRTISVLKAGSMGEAKNMAGGNPAIRNGLQVADVYEVKMSEGMVP